MKHFRLLSDNTMSLSPNCASVLSPHSMKTTIAYRKNVTAKNLQEISSTVFVYDALVL